MRFVGGADEAGNSKIKVALMKRVVQKWKRKLGSAAAGATTFMSVYLYLNSIEILEVRFEKWIS